MKAIIVSFALVGLGIGIYTGLGHADPPEPVKEKKTQEPIATAKRVDTLGDAMPDGAIMRLGTRRFRAQVWPWEPRPVCWQFRPDGKSYLAEQGSEIRRIDLTTGIVLESWRLPKSGGALAWAGADDHVVGFSPDGRYVLWTNDYIRHGIAVDSPQEWHLTLYDLTEANKSGQSRRMRGPKIGSAWAVVCLPRTTNGSSPPVRKGMDRVKFVSGMREPENSFGNILAKAKHCRR